jgi:lipoyl(octanoyl) transferase
MNEHCTKSTMKQIRTVALGRTRYAVAWDIQKTIFAARCRGAIGDVLILTEHDPVYTLGKGANENHVLADAAELASRSIDLHRIDRGGDVTFHGPGQIVGYPIIDLNNFYPDVHRYLRDLEEVLIRTLGEYQITAGRSDGYTGVWAAGDKVAAIGVKMQRWITMHGFALNVSTDLAYFDRIIPCGIFHKGVTSMEVLTGTVIPIDDVIPVVIKNFESVFGVSASEVSIDELLAECADATPAAKERIE